MKQLKKYQIGDKKLLNNKKTQLEAYKTKSFSH